MDYMAYISIIHTLFIIGGAVIGGASVILGFALQMYVLYSSVAISKTTEGETFNEDHHLSYYKLSILSLFFISFGAIILIILTM